ncbi:MAG: hypothetical protein H2050_02145 [Sphingobium sp.]|nr:hypothetical protein [Sphingobium sp.]
MRAHAAGGYSSPGAIFPYAAGFKGSADTGREAAEAINKKLGRLQRLVHGAVKGRGRYGLTAEEAAGILNMDRVSVQPRLSELKAMGLVKDSGLRRVNPSSRKRAVVWVLTEFAPVAGGDL